MFKIVTISLLILLICVQVVSASGSTIFNQQRGARTTPPPTGPADIDVNPSSKEVSLSFGQSADNKKSVTFTIINNGKTDVRDEDIKYPSTPSHITIKGPSSFTCGANSSTSVQFTIEASPSASGADETHNVEINIGGKRVTITVAIKYYAKIDVSPSVIHLGEIPSNVPKKESEPIRISEEYGYKTLEGVTISPASGNENAWVTVSPNKGIRISKKESVDVKFTLTPGAPDYERYDNKYTWNFIIEGGDADPVTITVKARILRPPKLGRLDDEKLKLKFDKPKGTVLEYDEYIDVRVRNKGDDALHFSSIVSKKPGGGIAIIKPSGIVSKKDSKKIKVHITVPYNTPEGTYQGKLHIYAKDGDDKPAGDDSMYITITVLWPVDFTISSTSPYFRSSPLSIDFGSLELKERDYDKKKLTLTLTEYYRYKPVENLRFSSSDEHSDWVKEERDFVEIPPGGTGDITLKIEPGLEAVPKHYSWKHYLSAREISAKRMAITAKIVPMNISEMIERLKAFRKSPSYKSYPSSENIISNGIDMLVKAEQSEIGAEDWKKIPVLTKGSLSLLSSLNDCIISNEEGNYRQVVEDLWTVWVSTSRIDSNSKLNNRGVSGYANGISIGADKTTEEVLTYEAKMLELRGWNIKKAVEHAIPTNDISVLKEEENVLESALSYQYAATLYGLLNDKKKRLDCVYEESRMMDKHDELVNNATDLRIQAENIILNAKENDLNRLWNTHLLSNPYDYDTASDSYKTAEGYLEDASKKYRFAGELIMAEDTLADLKELRSEWRYILSLFLLMCLVYGAAVIYVLNRIIRGTMAYMDDMREREVGDVVVS